MPQDDSSERMDAAWHQYRRTRRTQDRNRLVEHYAYLVRTLATRLARRLPAQVGYDEICSAAFEGLICAVENYDPALCTRFETYCQQRITGAVMDWLRSADGQSRLVRGFEKRRLKAAEALSRELNRPPVAAEIAERLGLDMDRYEELARLSKNGCQIQFSAIESRENAAPERRSVVWDVRDERAEDPSAGLGREMLSDWITRGLTRQERLTLILYYYESLTMTEIGAVLGLSESRVSQIHKDVLARLRRRNDAGLAEELAA